MIAAFIVLSVVAVAFGGFIAYTVLRKKELAQKSDGGVSPEAMVEIGSVDAEALDTGEIIECKLMKIHDDDGNQSAPTSEEKQEEIADGDGE